MSYLILFIYVFFLSDCCIADDTQSETRIDTMLNSSPRPGASVSTASAPAAKAAAVKGMSLASKGGKTKSYEDALVKEDKLAPVITTSKAAPSYDNPSTPAPQLIQQPVMLIISERGHETIQYFILLIIIIMIL